MSTISASPGCHRRVTIGEGLTETTVGYQDGDVGSRLTILVDGDWGSGGGL